MKLSISGEIQVEKAKKQSFFGLDVMEEKWIQADFQCPKLHETLIKAGANPSPSS